MYIMHKPETLKLIGHLRHITRAYTLAVSCRHPPRLLTQSPKLVSH